MSDRWQILAQEVDLEGNLRVQRTWLFGATTRRPALVLAFAHGTAPLDVSLAPGIGLRRRAVLLPRQRHPRGGEVARRIASRWKASAGFDTLDALCDAGSELFARQPWVEEFAAPLRSVDPDEARTPDGR